MTNDEQLKKIRRAIAPVVLNASNYPKPVAAQLLGRDMSEVLSKIADAVAAAGYEIPEEPEWEYVVRSKFTWPRGYTWDSSWTDEETARVIMSWDGPTRTLYRRRKAGPEEVVPDAD